VQQLTWLRLTVVGVAAAILGWVVTMMLTGSGATPLAVPWTVVVVCLVAGVAALWFGWPDAAMFIAKSALMGGVLAVGLIMLRRAAPATGLPQKWLTGTLLADGAPAPYGIALAAGALWTLPDSQIFLLAAL